MILVDSSVWIDFFNARESRETTWLKAALIREPILMADLVLAEVLQGMRSERSFALARDLMLQLRLVTVGGGDLAVEAARNYRRLRALGITVRKTIDTLIATRCIRDRIPLLYCDRDFAPFVEHLGLRSALDLPGAN
ncbi:MAG: PIN domain nuclease [Sphingomonas sp.]|uniref:type II toxin-antitoxin system VapC family toxin n=1 Tax=Sphingomonas sp. TaxID=28214 RepID=UPI001B2B47FF|nr:PIN domain nuclease [Sphingomonas sp.]MBO9621514.1 PIN domain nuclease [Sphingomonas sp.]